MPLHYACSKDAVELIDLLMEQQHGVDVNHENKVRQQYDKKLSVTNNSCARSGRKLHCIGR